MNKFLICSAVFVVLMFAWSYGAVTPSEQCPNEEFEDLRDRIQVSPCGKSRCKLRKGTNVTVNFKFKPKHVVKKLTNQVFANIAGVPLPFIGVDGTNACPQIRTEDGNPVSCPLQPDQEYLYTNIFPIERFYPSVPLRVHWALRDEKRNIICFEVPAAIA